MSYLQSRCTSTSLWKAMPTLISKMERYESCWLHHCMPRKPRRNPMHCFHLNRETWPGVLCSEMITRRFWEDLFLKVTRITCSIRLDQTWRSKSFMSSHSISASVIYTKRTEAESRAPQDVWNEFVESRREQIRLQEELLRKEKALRDTQIRSKHEMGKTKRAQVQQVDEFSV